MHAETHIYICIYLRRVRLVHSIVFIFIYNDTVTAT